MFDLLCIVGPTASGKTNLAVRLAAAFGGEIISADSRQVYRGMDIGTGKDLDEYVWEGKKIPYHLIDIVEAGYKYNVFEYQSDFVKVWEDCRQRGVLPVLCGGSGLYVEAVLKGYKLLAVPVDEDLRASLAGLSLPELAARLATYKKLHNTTEIDTPKRAIRAIEIEEYYKTHPYEEKDFPQDHPLVGRGRREPGGEAGAYHAAITCPFAAGNGGGGGTDFAKWCEARRFDLLRFGI